MNWTGTSCRSIRASACQNWGNPKSPSTEKTTARAHPETGHPVRPPHSCPGPSARSGALTGREISVTHGTSENHGEQEQFEVGIGTFRSDRTSGVCRGCCCDGRHDDDTRDNDRPNRRSDQEPKDQTRRWSAVVAAGSGSPGSSRNMVVMTSTPWPITSRRSPMPRVMHSAWTRRDGFPVCPVTAS